MPSKIHALHCILALPKIPIRHKERHDERGDGERRRGYAQDFHYVVVGCVIQRVEVRRRVVEHEGGGECGDDDERIPSDKGERVDGKKASEEETSFVSKHTKCEKKDKRRTENNTLPQRTPPRLRRDGIQRPKELRARRLVDEGEVLREFAGHEACPDASSCRGR